MATQCGAGTEATLYSLRQILAKGADGFGFGGAARVAVDHAVIAETVEDERRPGRWRLGRVDLLQRQLGQLPGLRSPAHF